VVDPGTVAVMHAREQDGGGSIETVLAAPPSPYTAAGIEAIDSGSAPLPNLARMSG